MPGPVLLWLLTLAVVAVGMRRGRAPRVAEGPRIPPLLRVGRRFPAPGSVVRALRGRQRDGDIAAAGLDTLMDGDDLSRVRAGFVTAGLALGGLLALASPVAVLISVPAAGLGLLVPTFVVSRRARQRRDALVRDLPDLIDVVVLCTDAGLPLESSLRVAVKRFRGVLADEIRGTLARLDLGTPRRVAYRGLASRMEVQELTSLVSAVLQAEELGTPVSAVLSRQAELLRANRRQTIRDRAAQAAPKVQLVVAMVMVPGALLLVVGVMILKLIGEMGVVVGAP